MKLIYVTVAVLYGNMRKLYYYAVIGAIGFCTGQKFILMWPEYSVKQ